MNRSQVEYDSWFHFLQYRHHPLMLNEVRFVKWNSTKVIDLRRNTITVIQHGDGLVLQLPNQFVTNESQAPSNQVLAVHLRFLLVGLSDRRYTNATTAVVRPSAQAHLL